MLMQTEQFIVQTLSSISMNDPTKVKNHTLLG